MLYLYLKSLTICSLCSSVCYTSYCRLIIVATFASLGEFVSDRFVHGWILSYTYIILLLSFAILKAQWWEYKCYFLIYCFLIYARLHFSIPFAALTMQIFTRCGTNKELLSYLISLLIGVQEEAWGPVPKHTTKSLNKTKVKYVFFALPPFNISQIKWNGKN